MIILGPVKTEKALGKIESENTMTFRVGLHSDKKQIKEEVEKLFEVKIDSVRTMIGPDGRKKAFVKLSKDANADKIVEKLKIMA